MTETEVRRRVLAIIALDPKARPIAVRRLAHIAGLSEAYLYQLAQRDSMLPATCRRLARALEWVENDQVEVHKRPNKPTEIVIRDPQPPQENLAQVVFDRKGRLRFQYLAVNPNAFPYRRG